MKIKAEIMQVLVAELQPNLIGAFYVMSLGFEIPDTVTKTDLTNIISFLCKKLGWIEEVDDTFRIKSSEEKQEDTIPQDILADSEIDKDENSTIDDWIEDSLSGPMVGNSEGDQEDSFHNALPLKSDYFDEIDCTQAIGIVKENVTTNKIPVKTSEVEINSVEGSETKEQVSLKGHDNKALRESFTCSQCDKKFTWRVNMNRHIRRKHKNPTYKPFNC